MLALCALQGKKAAGVHLLLSLQALGDVQSVFYVSAEKYPKCILFITITLVESRINAVFIM